MALGLAERSPPPWRFGIIALMVQTTAIRTIEIADAEVVRLLRNLHPTERIGMASAANGLVRERLRAHLVHDHPDC